LYRRLAAGGGLDIHRYSPPRDQPTVTNPDKLAGEKTCRLVLKRTRVDPGDVSQRRYGDERVACVLELTVTSLSSRTCILAVTLTCSKGAITSKIKHATKHKTSPARLALLLQPSSAFCFSLQPRTAHWTVRRHWLQAKT